VSYILFR
jgi:hypothetical protein